VSSINSYNNVLLFVLPCLNGEIKILGSFTLLFVLLFTHVLVYELRVCNCSIHGDVLRLSELLLKKLLSRPT